MNIKYKIYKSCFLLLCCCAMILVYTLLIFVFYKGVNSFSLELIFSNTQAFDAIFLKQRVYDGIYPAIIGTLMLIFLSLFFAILFGFSSGVYISIFASKKVKKILNLSFELLSSIPSILVGLFFLLLSIKLHESFNSNFLPSLLLSSLALSTLVTPYLVKNTADSLESIPKNIKSIGLNLGFSASRNFFKILLPYSSKELLSGIFLALGRACEDTAAIMLTGAVASAGIASSIFDRYEALPFYIYYISSNYADENELNKAFCASLVLLIIAMGLFFVTKLIQKGYKKHYGYS